MVWWEYTEWLWVWLWVSVCYFTSVYVSVQFVYVFCVCVWSTVQLGHTGYTHYTMMTHTLFTNPNMPIQFFCWSWLPVCVCVHYALDNAIVFVRLHAMLLESMIDCNSHGVRCLIVTRLSLSSLLCSVDSLCPQECKRFGTSPRERKTLPHDTNSENPKSKVKLFGFGWGHSLTT